MDGLKTTKVIALSKIRKLQVEQHILLTTRGHEQISYFFQNSLTFRKGDQK